MRQDYLNLICVRIQLKSSDPNHFPLEYIKLGSWDNLRRSLTICTSFALRKNSWKILPQKNMDSLILVPETIYMHEKVQHKNFSTGSDPEVYLQ